MNASNELIKRFEVEQKREYPSLNKPVDRIQPLVSVSVITYRHVDYIKECLDSILMQQTNFPFEIVLGDDGSDDGTTEICIEYAGRYPDVIRLFIRDRETSQYYEDGVLVCRFNGLWCRMSSRGKYIALCEGDDYWTDPSKLQKQVDIMVGSNGEIGGVGHQVNIVVNGEQRRLWREDIEEGFVVLNKFGDHRPFHTASFLFEKDIFLAYSFLFPGVVSGDKLTYLVIALQKPIYYINESMAVYRKHSGGVSANFDNQKLLQSGLQMYQKLLQSNLVLPRNIYHQFVFEEYTSWISRSSKFPLSTMISAFKASILAKSTFKFMKLMLKTIKARLAK